jgi:hypothetical protein
VYPPAVNSNLVEHFWSFLNHLAVALKATSKGVFLWRLLDAVELFNFKVGSGWRCEPDPNRDSVCITSLIFLDFPRDELDRGSMLNLIMIQIEVYFHFRFFARHADSCGRMRVKLN